MAAPIAKSRNLPDFPTELILLIATHLSQIELLSWSYTCRFFCRTLDTSTLLAKSKVCQGYLYLLNYNGVHLPSSVKRPAIRPGIVQHLDILNLLDRDGFLSPTKAICRPCANTHDRSRFSSTALKLPNYMRQCLGLEGRLWVCPHVHLSYEDVSQSPFSFIRRFLPKSSCQECRVNVHIGSSRSTVEFPIFIIPPGPQPRSNDLAAKLISKLKLHICPHARLGDAVLPDLTSSGKCKYMSSRPAGKSTTSRPGGKPMTSKPRGGSKTSKPKLQSCNCSCCSTFRTSGTCAICSSTIRFDIKTSPCGRRLLWVTIRRPYTTQGVCSQEWHDQIHQFDSHESLTKAWNQTMEVAEDILQDVQQFPYDPSEFFYAPRVLYCDLDWVARLKNDDKERGFARLPRRFVRRLESAGVPFARATSTLSRIWTANKVRFRKYAGRVEAQDAATCERLGSSRG